MTTIDIITDAAVEEMRRSHPEVDIAVIAAAAVSAAIDLRVNGAVEAVIAPNDGSVYRYVVLAKPSLVTSGKGLTPGWSGVQHPWFVALTDPVAGTAHEWSGNPVHHTYVEEKWTRGRVYDACVLSVFLGALSGELS
jgi:hypothetical protein